jgi:GNAT superfamily N-acetyltransferase
MRRGDHHHAPARRDPHPAPTWRQEQDVGQDLVSFPSIAKESEKLTFDRDGPNSERDRFLATFQDAEAFWTRMATFNAAFEGAESLAWPRAAEALQTAFLGVKIDRQRQGIGAALQDKTEALRRELQVPLYFPSTAVTLDMYKRRGYTVAGVAQGRPGESGKMFLLKLGDFGQ